MAEKSFAAATKTYFGLREGQRLAQFSDELKELTPEDKAELAPVLAAELGCTIKGF
jgi:hypothetical protein